MPQPYSAAWGDFDGDSFIDFYLTGYETPGYNEDSVFRNKGDGTFEVDWTTGHLPRGARRDRVRFRRRRRPRCLRVELSPAEQFALAEQWAGCVYEWCRGIVRVA